MPTPAKHRPTIDFLYSLMGSAPADWPGLRVAGIPLSVQEWAAQDAERQENLAVIWADVCREQPYEEMERVGMALVSLLLAAGVHPDEQEYVALYGGPLHWSCAQGYHDMVRLLLCYGADPDKADVDDSTPLHYAALNNQPECTRLLLAAGATPELPDCAGYTPLWWAVDTQAQAVEQLLRAHGATKMEFSEEDWEEYSKNHADTLQD